MYKILLVCSAVFLCLSCSKDHTVNLQSGVTVKFLEDVYPVPIEQTDAQWDSQSGKATMVAQGYSHNAFVLSLDNVHDTGLIVHPTIKNIYYTDGLDFVPDSLHDGYIRIATISDKSITGEFRVALDDQFNGAETRVVVGGFSIYTSQ